MSDPIEKRIDNIKNIRRFFESKNISQKSCDVKKNLKVLKNLGSGEFNKADLVCVVDDEEQCISDDRYVYRYPVAKVYKSEEEADSYRYDACLGDRYGLILSAITENDIVPYFPLMLNSYMCNNDYANHIPSSILEYSNLGDFMNVLRRTSNPTDITPLTIQVMLALYYMNMSMHISHNDMKPQNVLVKQLSKSVVMGHMLSNGRTFTLKSNKLALVADFDKTIGSTNNTDTKYLTDHYADFVMLRSSGRIHDIARQFKEQFSMPITYYEEALTRDAVQFIILMCLEIEDISVEVYLNFADDLLSGEDFVDSLTKHFSFFDDEESDIDHTYNLFQQVPHEIYDNYLDYRGLYGCALNANANRVDIGDQYIQDIFSITTPDYDNEVSSRDIKLIVQNKNKINIASDFVKPHMLPIMYGWVLQVYTDIKKEYPNKHYKILKYVFTMLDIVIENSKNVTKDNLQAYGAMCLYLFCYRSYPIIEMKMCIYYCADTYKKEDFYHVIDDILYTLYNITVNRRQILGTDTDSE